jgi:hypothetical protein
METNKNLVNEEVMNELKGIQWSTEPEETVAENKEIKAEMVEENKEPKNEVVEPKNEEVENKEVENKEVENKEPKVEQTTGKKRDVLKFGNKNWAEEIPEDKKFTEKTVFCWKPGEDDKIGYFSKYGKKEGMIWINMYKKDSFNLMSREWAARLSDCEVIEQDGVMLKPERYFKDDKGYHVKKDNKDEVAATTTPIDTPIDTVATQEPEQNKEEKIEMPMAE